MPGLEPLRADEQKQSLYGVQVKIDNFTAHKYGPLIRDLVSAAGVKSAFQLNLDKSDNKSPIFLRQPSDILDQDSLRKEEMLRSVPFSSFLSIFLFFFFWK